MNQTSSSQSPSQYKLQTYYPPSGRQRKTPHIITCTLLFTSFLSIGSNQLVAQRKQPATLARKPLTAAKKEQVTSWIKDLGARKYVKRQQAQTRLLTFGWPAIPFLQQAHQDPNPERRFRARQLTKEIRHRRSYREFQELGRQADNTMDLDQAMIAIARLINPLTDENDLKRQLDQLAAEVRKQLGPNISPAKVAPARAVAVIQQVIFKQHGFTGETTNYDHPNNSSLAHVLKTHKGLPILLSHIVVSVGDRVDLPFVGVPVPGRYMVKYDGKRGPGKTPQDDILIDPFGGGKILTLEQLQAIIPGIDRESAFQASTKRETVVRMLRNLEADYQETGNLEAADRTASYRWLVDR